ncbi:MAG: hypothetical protein Q9174_003354 [Haloplaca sp. 1 TL-2023]
MFLTRQNVLKSHPRIATFSQSNYENPTLARYELRNILDYYSDAFYDFFRVHPFSICGHASDALNPSLLGSLITFLRAYKTKESTNGTTNVTQLAVMDGSYGAGFSPLAHHSVCNFSNVANGPKPIRITMNRQTIPRQLKVAKDQGCILFLVEMVRAQDSPAMNPAQ